MVVWENTNNESVLAAAREELMKATNGKMPEMLDPFAGGGTIPLEGQRLGLNVRAHDLNPVAVMINKAMIEIPPVFSGYNAVNPESRRLLEHESVGISGLVEDVRYYGEWIRNEACKRLGHMYPQIDVPKSQGGGKTDAVAWIWAHTVKCPNPACGCEMPLANGFTLSKKKGHEAYVEPVFDREKKQIKYTVRLGGKKPDNEPKLARGANFKCIMCGEATTPDYIKEESFAGRLGSVLIGGLYE